MPSRDDWDDEAPPPPPFADAPPPPPDVLPQGEVYDWYVRGLDLLEGGNAAAAVTLLTHAANSEPESRSVREALARAQFDSGLYDEAVQSFSWIISINPADDYAQFGLGLAAAKIGDLPPRSSTSRWPPPCARTSRTTRPLCAAPAPPSPPTGEAPVEGHRCSRPPGCTTSPCSTWTASSTWARRRSRASVRRWPTCAGPGCGWRS